MPWRKKKTDKLSAGELSQLYCQTGKQRYATALFDRFYLLVTGVCFNFIRDRDEAASVALAVLQRFFEKAAEEVIKSPEAWLYRAGRNASLNYLRGKRHTLRLEHTDIPQPDVVLIDEQEALLRRESLLHQALKSLCPEQRDAVSLFYLEGLSYARISHAKGWTMMQVKSYIQNGKRNIKMFIENHENARTA